MYLLGHKIGCCFLILIFWFHSKCAMVTGNSIVFYLKIKLKNFIFNGLCMSIMAEQSVTKYKLYMWNTMYATIMNLIRIYQQYSAYISHYGKTITTTIL